MKGVLVFSDTFNDVVAVSFNMRQATCLKDEVLKFQ